jgi:hypothetical protein
MPDEDGNLESGPKIVVVWDPELVAESEYSDLMVAVAQLVRAHGGHGLHRIEGEATGAAVEVGVYS